MTERPVPAGKVDRLSAFFRAFDLSVSVSDRPTPGADARLMVVGDARQLARQLVLDTDSPLSAPVDGQVLVVASISFGGSSNPLIVALPERVVVDVDESTVLHGIASGFVEEALNARCGQSAVIGRLCEVMLLLVLRQVIDAGTRAPGLLAGLSHPALHRALVAMHDAPDRPWRVEDLACVSGLSRSQFMASFRQTVGTTPSAYLTAWRLMLARRALANGAKIKAVAQRVGFGSASAFSRAYVRAFGHPPIVARHG
ncbi:AraC family transcriptional regulator [Trinickia dabaoshanensis]|uniref:AraC family transcriptional regulator n=1 Tax=Trinickia dabaoshanensis TaxID=564714 RepID=A0A2N7VGD4_9BURK|nr:AraC family transcriptional regulator [Trinickia dabaoshanensis]PMS16211.1 AraC family transcriptional regulator [Trinickia dabaoshanensis]